MKNTKPPVKTPPKPKAPPKPKIDVSKVQVGPETKARLAAKGLI